MIQDLQGPNLNAVWIALIGSLSTTITTLATFWLTRNRLQRAEGTAGEAVAQAAEAVRVTVQGDAVRGEQLEAIHKTVNGRTDALMEENRRLVAALAEARAALARKTPAQGVRPPVEPE